MRSWIARAGVDAIGLVQLEIRPGNEVEITKFGLVPEFVGRVWLHTSSFDHPHALRNYFSRGFHQFKIVHRPRDMPG